MQQTLAIERVAYALPRSIQYYKISLIIKYTVKNGYSKE